jgi:hypothetical protein
MILNCCIIDDEPLALDLLGKLRAQDSIFKAYR